MKESKPESTDPSYQTPSLQKRKESIPELLSIHKAAKVSGLGRNNLAFLIRHEKLPVVKIPGYNRIKIHYNDLVDFINNSKFIHR
jgi:hypothetical protein